MIPLDADGLRTVPLKEAINVTAAFFVGQPFDMVAVGAVSARDG
jgi:hypothetical protein